MSEEIPNAREKLKKLRKKIGYSQRQMAKAFNVAPGSISLWENGERKIPGPVEKLLEIYEKNLYLHDQETIDSICSGRWERVWQGAKLASKSSVNWMKVNLVSKVMAREKAMLLKQETTEAIYRDLFKHLSDLRGLHMKIGQMFGFMKDDLPESVKKFVQPYQYSLKPMSPHIIEEVVFKEFNQSPQDIFKVWHSLPFAGGSIGQVHMAEDKSGELLAVKVQYPRIVEALHADFKNIELLQSVFNTLFRSAIDGVFVDEIRERLLEECDYKVEKKNIVEFQKVWNGDSVVCIPKVKDQYCSRYTLATEYVEGEDFHTFLKNSTQEEKDKLGETLFRFHFTSIYKHRIFNADPHPGNYIMRDGKVYFIDFGCVARFSKSTIDQLRSIFIPLLNRDFEAFKVASIESGFVGDEERFNFKDHYEAMMLTCEPVNSEPYQYRFNHHYVREIFRRMVLDTPNLPYSNIRKEMVFLQRLQFGMYSILADLNATADWRSIYMNALDLDENKI